LDSKLILSFLDSKLIYSAFCRWGEADEFKLVGLAKKYFDGKD